MSQSDWEEVGRLPLPPPIPGAPPTAIAVFGFDTTQELLWIGNEFGRVSSFYGRDLQLYSSLRAGRGPIRQLLFNSRGVIVLGQNYVHMAIRRGTSLWHITHEDMKDLRCMSYTSKGNSEIIVAGFQDQMFIVNVDKGTVTRQIHTTGHYKYMKRSRYICAASQKGSVDILDPLTYKVVKTWNAHAAGISDMDAQHDFIVTCGYSHRQYQNQMLDPLVNVFDLKNMQPLSPIPFPAGAAFVRLHPRMSTTSIIVGQYGQIHIVDLMNVNTSNVKQANVVSNGALISMIEIAPSGEALILADQECTVHLWGSPSRIQFCELSKPTAFAEADEAVPQLNWSNDEPLSTVGLPYYREQLLSSWPSHMVFEIGAPPSKISSQLIQTLKSGPFGYTGPNPRGFRRNQVENTRISDKPIPTLQAPKFLSEMQREAADDAGAERKLSDVVDTISAAERSSLKADVPVMYRNVEIKYSKFGVDDFDFGFFNKTSYSGLEIHISNSYANSLLQVLHFTPIIRNLALHHAAGPCIGELCLLCEMGYLFDMLEKAEGIICQATNLLKTLGHIPQAAALHLLEEDAPGSSLTKMLQGLTRFLTDKITADWKSLLPHQNIPDQIMTVNANLLVRCMNCRSEVNTLAPTTVVELLYPAPKLSPRNQRAPRSTFSDILKKGLEWEQTCRGWCGRCGRYLTVTKRKQIQSVPQVLMLNAAVNTPEARQFWSNPGCLPEEIGVIIDKGQFFCFEGKDLQLHLERGIYAMTVYSLVGFVADVDSGQHQKSHLVSLINVGHSLQETPDQSQWYLFNDFLVRPVKKEEALSFNTSWKIPSVITYQQKVFNNKVDNSWKRKLDTSVLYMDKNTNPGEKTYRPLVPSIEAPGEGTIIAIDCEFVSIKQAEIAVNAEGTRHTIRPTVHALARVSVVRGSGEDALEPFIDDYIATKEPVVDYITSYSGIVPGDLDPRTSKHNLVPLKVAYKKLWILVNLGCTFLGHGLKQDFRVANIQVPKAQVIDTYHLFYVELRRRRLSLAFLAWSILKEDIQLETHDSIEDAKTALKLYRKWQEFKDAGVLQAMLDETYRKGQGVNYKAPQARRDGVVVQRSGTPPIVADGGVSGPTTPIRRPLGLRPGSGYGSASGSSGWTPQKGSGLGMELGGSPLR